MKRRFLLSSDVERLVKDLVDLLSLLLYSKLDILVGRRFAQESTAMRALEHLLTTTSVVPLTEGNKMKLRHFGHALDVTFGPLKLFMTCNFADTYIPLTVILHDPAN